MQSAILKPLRISLAALYFLLTVLLFSQLASFLPSQMVRCITWLQFVPSVLKFSTTVSIGASGFIMVILITLLFGRVYCSFVCPLGILQDISISTSDILIKKTNSYKRPLSIISYTVLGISILPVFFHNIFFLNLLDPFALSGKILSGIREALFMSLMLLLFFVLLSFLKKRWYCNMICPVGIFLGLLSRISFFRISIEGGRCSGCGRCESVCKSNCIDSGEHHLDFDRCVGCMNCLDSCPEKAILYRFSLAKKEIIPGNAAAENVSRRNFIKTSVGGAAAIAGLMAPARLFAGPGEASETNPVMPPGAISIWHFTEKCTACQLCISSCPTHVLQPSFFEYGLSGIFQPRMDFKRSFCKYDCTRCLEVCPTGAIQLSDLLDKKKIQIGLAVFEKNQCLVVEQQKPCAKCSEHCEAKAIELLPYLGELKIPKVDSKRCNGCGACEYYCPVKPDKAIYVEGNVYQRKLV
jgi:ferredoxin-type protein NapF